MDRRNFLKLLGTFFLGTIFLRFQKLFGSNESSSFKKDSLKEAKFYTSSDHLAG